MMKKARLVAGKILGKLKGVKKRHDLKNKPVVTLSEIKDGLKALGLKLGDVVLLHSSLSQIGYVEGGPDTLLDAILDIIGPGGTLVVPTYPLIRTMLHTCQMKDFIYDPATSPTFLGSIPSAFLKRTGTSRSIHPTHALSALGKEQEYITATHHIGDKTYGENSPWAKIVELKGKILGIGITLGPHTIYHHVEDIMGNDFPLKVKVAEVYPVKARLSSGEMIDVNVQPLDPEIAKTRIDKPNSDFIRDYFWEIFTSRDVLKLGIVGQAKSWITDAKAFCDLVERLARIGITIYSTEEYLLQNGLYPYEKVKNKL